MKPTHGMNRRHFVQLGALAAGAALAPRVSAEAAKTEGYVANLPALPYGYGALEPSIDARTMEIHHSKHHAGYASKLNDAWQGLDQKFTGLDDLLPVLPTVKDEATRAALRNNGGGHWNHSLFWQCMAPADQTGKPSDKLGAALQSAFGSIEDFKAAFAKAAATRFGSGWAWLILKDGKLRVTSTPNQDNPWMKGLVPDEDIGTPLLGLDVWEHAYYLHYQNRRGDYIDAWWKVVNWNEVSKRYAEA